MYTHDMQLKMEKSKRIVAKAIECGGGHTILSTGITGDDARLARAVVDAGVTMLEPNHPAVVLARGYRGITSMDEAEAVRHEIKVSQMAEVTRGVRAVCGEDVYITVGIPGGFTEVMPTPLADEDFLMMAQAGASGLHTHKSSLEDLEDIVERAHANGLCVDAYIGLPTDKHIFGLPALTPEEVEKVARQMESIGTDMIGIMTGMSYEGVEAGQIPAVLKERVEALVGAVKVPTLAEGGINLDNYKAFHETGVNILVIGTSIDKMVEQAAKRAVSDFLNDY